jgi:two-component system chemotaxis response regulator CheB
MNPLKPPVVKHPPPAPGFRAVVIGVSAGGIQALSTLLPLLPKDFSLPILVVQHRLAGSDDYITKSLNQICAMQVKEAEEKEAVKAGCVYLAPADYHLLVERDQTLSLSVDEKVNYSRPAIDVLFESAAYAWSSGLIGIVLTGANSDGAKGLALIKQLGGTAIVQDPDTAEHGTMPRAALASADYVLELSKIGDMLEALTARKQNFK